MDSSFSRFGDIPGVDYEVSQRVDRRYLPGHDTVPELHVIGSDSPVHSRTFGKLGDMPTATLLQYVYEGLELPGKSIEYHILIERCVQELQNRQRQEPEVLEHVERLCWLDLQLIEACPDVNSYKRDGESHFYYAASFSTLIHLYEREGLLREALEVAERAARFELTEAGKLDRQRLLERIASVEGENGG